MLKQFLKINFLFVVLMSVFSMVCSSSQAEVKHVFLISIDGLRGDAIETLGANEVPNLYNLFIENGSYTNNARADMEYTETLPGHASQITGRQVSGTNGHGWDINHDDPTTDIHARKGSYVSSFFDVAHSAGVITSLDGSKSKFDAYNRSYPSSLDFYHVDGNTQPLNDVMMTDFQNIITNDANAKTYFMVHFRDPDTAAHVHGGDLSTPNTPYSLAIKHVDGLVGQIVSMINANNLTDETIFMVTADHGASLTTEDPTAHVFNMRESNFRIPVGVSGPGVCKGCRLYALNADAFKDPGSKHSDKAIYHYDVANIGLYLLGLPAIPGSKNEYRIVRVDEPKEATDLAVVFADNIFGSIQSMGGSVCVNFDLSHSSGSSVTSFDPGDLVSPVVVNPGNNVNHCYSTPGIYEAKLKKGLSEDHVSIVVTSVNGEVRSQFTPEKDACLNPNASDLNYGIVDLGLNGSERIAISFGDVKNKVPRVLDIIDAKLILTSAQNIPLGTNIVLSQINPVKKWEEGFGDGNSAPPSLSNFETIQARLGVTASNTNAGGDGSSSWAVGDPVGPTVAGVIQNNKVTFDVTNMIQHQTAEEADAGFVIWDVTSQSQITFDSREGQNPPKLAVRLGVPAGMVQPIQMKALTPSVVSPNMKYTLGFRYDNNISGLMDVLNHTNVKYSLYPKVSSGVITSDYIPLGYFFAGNNTVFGNSSMLYFQTEENSFRQALDLIHNSPSLQEGVRLGIYGENDAIIDEMEYMPMY